MRFVAFALAACFLVPAVAASNTVDYAFSDNYKALKITMKSDISGTDASKFRKQADQQGDANGQASQDEIDAMVSQMSDQMQMGFEQSMTSGNFNIDGHPPTSAFLNSVTSKNGPGAVSSTATITMTMDAGASYDADAGTDHTLDSKAESSSGETGTIVIHTASGSVIKSTTGSSHGFTTTDGAQETFSNSPSQFPSATLKFGPKPPASSSSSSSSSTSSHSSSSATSSKASSSSSSNSAARPSSTSSSSSKAGTPAASSDEKSSPAAGLAVLFALVAVAIAVRRRLP